MTPFYKQFFQGLSREVQESEVEEHNRYCRAPKGVEPLKWCFNKMLLKYDFFPVKKAKKDD